VLTFEAAEKPRIEPLMGWTGGGSPLATHEMTFPTAEAAIRFAQRKGWLHAVTGGGAPPVGRRPEPAPCAVDETLEQSFPASDAPSWTLGRNRDARQAR
jgi:hypothetical protein